MKLLLHDSLATSPLVHPFQEGWVDSSSGVDVRAAVTAADVGQHVAAIVPSAEIAKLQSTHVVVPSVAVIWEGHGLIAMRVPVRPDEIATSDVRLYDVSSTAEVLARAVLEPFYGIAPTTWTEEDDSDAQVVIVEGATALNEPEAGLSEDLVRAWFIMTGLPVVTHLFVVPNKTDSSHVIELMRQARSIGHERRRDLRRATAERFDVDRERLVDMAASARYELLESDRRALLKLLQNGNKGFRYPYLWQIAYHGEVLPDLPPEH
jgi:predicted solute-binding protein